MFKNNLPRYWVGWYDRWHLLLALFLVLLLCLAGYLITLPMTPPILRASGSGSSPQAGQPLDLAGTAPANGLVSLWDGSQRIDATFADANGAYKFVVRNLAAGAHSFKTVAEADGKTAESAVLSLTASAPVVLLQPTATTAPTPTPLAPTATAIPPSPTALPPTAAPTRASATATTIPPTPTAAATAAPAAGTVQRRGKDSAEMVYIPASEFTAGGEVTRTVYIDAYWLDRTEVTNEQFKQFADASGYKTEAEKQGSGYEFLADKWELIPNLTWLTPRGAGSTIADKAKYPVVFVTWDDANAYCTWAGKRLATEAEWEKAARGSDARNLPWGKTFDGTKVNYCDENCPYPWKDNSANDGYAESAPVGSYSQGASPYGALDMAGNVWEWVADWFTPDYPKDTAARNPTGPASGVTKVLRGGAWSIGQSFTSAVSRFNNVPMFREGSVGLRCAQ